LLSVDVDVKADGADGAANICNGAKALFKSNVIGVSVAVSDDVTDTAGDSDSN
jgi:hypothetical protein